MLYGATGRGQNQTHCLRVMWLNKLNYTCLDRIESNVVVVVVVVQVCRPVVKACEPVVMEVRRLFRTLI